MTLRGQFFTTM